VKSTIIIPLKKELSHSSLCPEKKGEYSIPDGERHIPSSTLTKNYQRVFGSDEIGTFLGVELA
jgi:hypothetical protein